MDDARLDELIADLAADHSSSLHRPALTSIAALREEVARLTRALDAIARLRKDAERYRWWRNNYGLECDGPGSYNKLYTLVGTDNLHAEGSFDAAIDAAIADAKE